MMLLAVFLLFLTSWDIVIARYVVILEEAFHNQPSSKITVNYTYTRETNKGVGYVDILEKIEPNSHVQLSVSLQLQSQTNNANYNISKTDFCVFLNTDMIYLPYLREYVYLEKFCPVNKGKHTFHKSTIFSKYKPFFPLGCMKLKVLMKKNEKFYAGFDALLQIQPSLESDRLKCRI